MIAGINNNCIFTEPNNSKEFSLRHGIFYAYKSGYQIPVHDPVSYETDSFCLATKMEGGSLSYIDSTNLIFTNKMPNKVKITPKLNNSKLKSTSVARHATPTLTLTGVKNPYLFCLRKIFRDFLEEEKRGHCFTEKRLLKKIESAMLLFPESRKALINHLKH